MSTTTNEGMLEVAAKRYMRTFARFFVNCGEIDATKLAESTAEYFGLNESGGPLDDPTHDLWTWAADIADEYEVVEP